MSWKQGPKIGKLAVIDEILTVSGWLQQVLGQSSTVMAVFVCIAILAVLSFNHSIACEVKTG